MTDTQKNLEAVLKTLAKADSLLADGRPIEDVCEEIEVDKDTLQAWADHLSLPQNPAAVLSSCHIHDAVFPIFTAERPSAPLDHIGSGVVIEVFLRQRPVPIRKRCWELVTSPGLRTAMTDFSSFGQLSEMAISCW